MCVSFCICLINVCCLEQVTLERECDLSFYCVGLGDHTQVVRLCSKCLYLLSILLALSPLFSEHLL